MPWYNPSDPTQRNWMLGGLMCLLIVIPYRMYVLAPRQEANGEVQTRVESLEEQNRRAGVLAARGGGDLEERLQLYERHVSRLEELIPASEEVANLADDIQSRARAVGVDVKTFVPEPVQAGEFYDRFDFEISVVGEYHSVGRFLAEIGSLSRIVTPVDLDVQLYTQVAEYPELESPVIATFRIGTYVLPDPANRPAADVGGGA